MMRVLVTIAALLIGLSAAGRPAAAQTGETVDHSALRVCADANNLPFSNDKGEGFENKIAEVVAADLKVPVKVFGKDFTKEKSVRYILADQHEHLGQLIAYARSNGVVPPWSK